MKNSNKRKLKTNKILLIVACVCLIVGLFTVLLSNNSKTKDNEHHNYIATVMIDAGHGGYDGGTIGADGTCEKDLTLELALETGKQPQKINPDIKVVYTRTSDKITWPEDEVEDLTARVEMAKKENADYYFSFHINSNDDPSCDGYVSYIRKDDKVSKKITKYLSKNLSDIDWSYDRGTLTTESYPLHVVDLQKIPSILFEAGFITNPNELQQLKDSTNQKKIAKAVAKAFDKYITENK